MANTLLNIARAFINQANTDDVKGAVASRGQANANARNVKAGIITTPGETTTKLFRRDADPPSIRHTAGTLFELLLTSFPARCS